MQFLGLGFYNALMLLPTVTPQQIRDAMPRFQAGLHLHSAPSDAERLPIELRVRCALANHLLNSTEGTLEDGVYGLVAVMQIDVDEMEKRSD